MRRSVRRCGSGLALFLMVASARADVVTFDSIASLESSSNPGAVRLVTVAVPRFTPALGTLTAAEFDVSYTLDVTGTVTNPDPANGYPSDKPSFPPLSLFVQVHFGITGPGFVDFDLLANPDPFSFPGHLFPSESRPFTTTFGDHETFGAGLTSVQGPGTVAVNVSTGGPKEPPPPGVITLAAVKLTGEVRAKYTFIPATAVPEPSSLALASIGGLALVGHAWRSRRRAGRSRAGLPRHRRGDLPPGRRQEESDRAGGLP